MTSTVYGGVLCIPDHPQADMHGLVRACLRVKARIEVQDILVKSYKLTWYPSAWAAGIWAESASAAELIATKAHYGRLLVAPLSRQYLTAGDYSVWEAPGGSQTAETTSGRK